MGVIDGVGLSQGSRGRGSVKVPESGARMEGGGAGFSQECPDGEGVASFGEALTLSKLLTPGTVGPEGEAGMSDPQLYCPAG